MELFSIRIQRTFQLVSTIDDKIRCNIAPTRRDADTLIYNKHTGIPLQK